MNDWISQMLLNRRLVSKSARGCKWLELSSACRSVLVLTFRSCMHFAPTHDVTADWPMDVKCSFLMSPSEGRLNHVTHHRKSSENQLNSATHHVCASSCPMISQIGTMMNTQSPLTGQSHTVSNVEEGACKPCTDATQRSSNTRDSGGRNIKISELAVHSKSCAYC